MLRLRGAEKRIMLGDKAPGSRGSSFYIENLLGSAYRGGKQSPETSAGRLDKNWSGTSSESLR